MRVKGILGEALEGNDEQVGQWRKDDLCYKVAENVAKLCFVIGWKVEFVWGEFGSEISK